MDAIVNLTFPGVHAEVTTAALKAGKHVHSEKPLAGDYAAARSLVDLAAERGLRLSCSPITFMGEAQETMRRLVESGAIGRCGSRTRRSTGAASELASLGRSPSTSSGRSRTSASIR